MRNVKLVLEYDGTDFFGFQSQFRPRGKQPRGTGSPRLGWSRGQYERRTVQAEIERALAKLFGKRMQIAAASGRTDSGVHAKSQVVNFKTNSKLPIQNIQRALNRYLAKDISVLKAEDAPLHFHSRFSARRKIYEYAVWNAKERSPLRERFAYHFPYRLSLPRMREAAKSVKGKHNFRSFQAKAGGGNSVRTLKKVGISKRGHEVRFSFEGDGFLYNMVRNLVGTLLLVGSGKVEVSEFKEILLQKNRKHIGPTAPPHGLFLTSVRY